MKQGRRFLSSVGFYLSYFWPLRPPGLRRLVERDALGERVGKHGGHSFSMVFWTKSATTLFKVICFMAMSSAKKKEPSKYPNT